MGLGIGGLVVWVGLEIGRDEGEIGCVRKSMIGDRDFENRSVW